MAQIFDLLRRQGSLRQTRYASRQADQCHSRLDPVVGIPVTSRDQFVEHQGLALQRAGALQIAGYGRPVKLDRTGTPEIGIGVDEARRPMTRAGTPKRTIWPQNTWMPSPTRVSIL